MERLKVFISGMGFFAESVLREVSSSGMRVLGVSCPAGDKYIGRLASTMEIPITPAGILSADNFPDGVDIGIAAHSFDYIGKRMRYRPRLGWIGYHPSLLPRHRGRSSIEWAIKMRDPVTGGTVFWLDAGIDRGDIAEQEFIFIDPALFALDSKEAARVLWRGELQQIGVRLIMKTLLNAEAGIIKRVKQDKRFSTFEPSTDVKDIYRPDAIMIEQNARSVCDWYK